MNKEYIEREATKTEIASYFDILIYEKPEGIEPNLNNLKLALLNLIDYNTVTANVAPVIHGEWEVCTEYSVFGLYQVGWRCSLCGRTESYKQPYCNCGAKMDGGKE